VTTDFDSPLLPGGQWYSWVVATTGCVSGKRGIVPIVGTGPPECFAGYGASNRDLSVSGPF